MTTPAGEDSQLDATLTGSGSGGGQTPRTDPTRLDWLAEYPPPRSLPLDREALRIFEHAYALGLAVERPGAPPVTFSTVIAALVTGRDETSRWFAQLAQRYGPLETAVFEEKATDRSKVEELRPSAGKPESIRLSSDKHLLTASARSLLGIAEGWAQKVRGSEIGVRHLVASYVLNPPAAHRSQMLKWKYQEPQWRQHFFTWVAQRYTAEQWTDASYRAAPAQAIPEIERVDVKGAQLAFPGDANALGVLKRATKLHTRRSEDAWLRLQTLWHALIETRTEAGLEEPLAPIAEAVAKAGQQYTRAFNRYFSTTPRIETAGDFDALDISPRVLNALETARELAVAARKTQTSEVRVSVLHLAGALASRRVDADPELRSFGFQPNDLRSQLIARAQKLGESADVWRDALGAEDTTEAGRPLDLNSDEPEAVVRSDATWAEDPLQIRRDVETFAALLACTSLEPPLSIGLFGPWGSGKTTFLKRLQRAVQRRADEAQEATKAGKRTAYVRHVVHVDFNAWHFAEGALTSSLVDTILRKIGEHITAGEPTVGKEWERRKLAALESTKRKVAAAQAVVDAASVAVTTAQTTLITSQQSAAKAAIGLRAAVGSVWSATRSAFTSSSDVAKSGVLDKLGDTVASAEELSARLESLRRRPARMLGDLGWVGTLVFAALVLGVPLFVAWMSKQVLETHQAAQVLSSAVATASVIGVWARTASASVARADKAIDDIAREYANRIAADEGVGAARSDLAKAEASAATAASGLKAVQEELARASADAASASLPSQLLRLVTSRIDAQSYNKELTTTSLARADLEAMSLLLRAQCGEPATASGNGARTPPVTDTPSTPAGQPVDRVILYIDDLDRCKPDDVVRVLQLVHMLLAFELFAVVVAVDARWVRESLHQSYPWLAPDEVGGEAETRVARAVTEESGAARREPVASRLTPQDYLEKIFQIAFWLTPMTVGQAADYLRSLVRVHARESTPVIGAAVAGEAAALSAVAVDKVEIDPIELEYMCYLASYIGSSPRRVKRLVNAYRLIKASLTDSQLETFITRSAPRGGARPSSGPYQLVIGLLVIGTGAPTSAARIFRAIEACDSTATPDEVVTQFRAYAHPDWTMAAQVIEALMRTQKVTDIRELRNWVSKVGRFLLNSPLDGALYAAHFSARSDQLA